MANILMLTPQLPYPAHQGTSLRNLHMLRALAQDNSVTLLSFADREVSLEITPLMSLCRVLDTVTVPLRTTSDRVAQMATSGLPDVALRLRSDEFVAALTTALRMDNFDAVQVEGIELAAYMQDIRRISPSAKIILDCHNAETELQRRAFSTNLSIPSRWPMVVYSGVQVRRLARFEKWALQEADRVIGVSKEDKYHLEKLSGSRATTIVVIPNTIDVSEYAEPLETIKSDQTCDLVFTGKMDYRPNIDGVLWFAENVWPQLKRIRPQSTWAIVGQRPDDRVRALEERDGILVTGHVPAIQPYIHGASVYIVPLRIGSGTRLKLIEAIAAGKAIVSTSVGAEGIDFEDGENIILADTSPEWVEALIRLLDDATLRSKLGTAAQQLAVHYDWRQIVGQVNALYQSIISAE